MPSIELKKPVTNGAETVSTLTWRAIRLGDYPVVMTAVGSLAQGQLGAFSEDLLNLVAHFSGLPRAVVDEIDEVDGQPVLDSLADHLAAHMAKVKK
ncbi:phage tail assembly protein [Shinella sp. JR1-6]|uniref:phage tail assembly protein n=1 Tax=Shinella sp. JR1-6 TaxID=2527671 RepID=UPI00102D5A70|nr:phage tail assembly protein [Shinella sp. JR1-6]TAA55284.1 phage tail assembly protein [Shinella sp. JR1-6]